MNVNPLRDGNAGVAEELRGDVESCLAGGMEAVGAPHVVDVHTLQTPGLAEVLPGALEAEPRLLWVYAWHEIGAHGGRVLENGRGVRGKGNGLWTAGLRGGEVPGGLLQEFPAHMSPAVD